MAKVITITCNSDEIFKKLDDELLQDIRNAIEHNIDGATESVELIEDDFNVHITIKSLPEDAFGDED